MTGMLTASVRIRAETITGWVIAVLGIATVIMIAFGWLRVLAQRRRPQVVINDVELGEDVPAEVAAGLSLQLRQMMRRALHRQDDDARQSAMETLDDDIAAGLVTVHGATTMKTTVEDLDRTTQDSMSSLSAGLRAVGPKEAEGLAAALELAIPAQRGWSVRAFPVILGDGVGARAGLNLEVARFGHAPEAVTTFWTTSGALQKPASDAARLAAIRELLHELIPPASTWIAIQLVSRHLTHTHGRGHWLPGHRKELTGLQLQLAGQMLLYATRAQEKFADGFANEALDYLERAAELLPHYYRPRVTQGAVYERRGWSCRHSGNEARAQQAFARAVDAYDEAENLLQACQEADTSKRDAAIERLALRRTKCRLLSCDRDYTNAIVQELSEYSQLKDMRPVPSYNAACLFAVAMGCPNLSGDQLALSERRAWHYLGHALVLSPTGRGPWARMITDEELSALDIESRKKFGDEIKKRRGRLRGLGYLEADRIVEAAMAALGPTGPSTRAAV